MAETVNGCRKTPATGWTKPDGLYQVPNGPYFYVIDGVLHLPVHAMSPAVVLAKRKRVFLLGWRDANPLVFMRAADVIAAWPQVELQVRNTAAVFGLAL